VITSLAFDTADHHGPAGFPMSRHTGFRCLETSVSYVLNQHTAQPDCGDSHSDLSFAQVRVGS
jgi:hypothetical protein